MKSSSTALNNSSIVDKVYAEFKKDFDAGTIVDEEYIRNYQILYDKKKIFLSNQEAEFTDEAEVISPNQMQGEALEYLMELRKENKSKALIISATGTGKLS